jgi:hypothetical protein
VPGREHGGNCDIKNLTRGCKWVAGTAAAHGALPPLFAGCHRLLQQALLSSHMELR